MDHIQNIIYTHIEISFFADECECKNAICAKEVEKEVVRLNLNNIFYTTKGSSPTDKNSYGADDDNDGCQSEVSGCYGKKIMFTVYFDSNSKQLPLYVCIKYGPFGSCYGGLILCIFYRYFNILKHWHSL